MHVLNLKLSFRIRGVGEDTPPESIGVSVFLVFLSFALTRRVECRGSNLLAIKLSIQISSN